MTPERHDEASPADLLCRPRRLHARQARRAEPSVARDHEWRDHGPVYLPDAKAGFYRSTRFDWSGAIASLEYKGHKYYGTWFTKITDIYDFGYDGPTTTWSRPSSRRWSDRPRSSARLATTRRSRGGLFVKPGIGVLRRADETPVQPLEAVRDRQRRQVGRSRRRRDSIEFTHTLKRAGDRVRLRLHQDHPAHAEASRR